MNLKRIILIANALLGIVSFANAQNDTSYNYQKPLFDFSYEKPALRLQGEQLVNKNRHLRYAAFTGYREGVEPIKGQFGSNFKASRDTSAGTHRFFTFNLSIEEMCLRLMEFAKPNRMIFEVKDVSKYHYDPKYGDRTAWLRKNGYCFELIIPATEAQNTIKIVDGEIERFFNIKFGREKRMVKTLVLVRTSDVDKIKTSGEKSSVNSGGHFVNVSLDWIGNETDKTNILPPFVNETGYKGLVDLDLKITSWADLAAVRKALSKYDLDLKEDMREVEMYVIKEVK